MIVVIDIETQKSFAEVKDKNPKDLKVSVAGVLVKKNNNLNYQGFWENELAKLWPILEQAELVVGFNLYSFDYPVLSAYYSGDLFKLPTLDILKEFKDKAGHRISLNRIAASTLGEKKTGHGMEAISLFNQGRLDELKKYCLKDVELTYKVYEYGKKFGLLKYINKWNNEKTVKINFNKIDNKNSKVQMTLTG
jgi:DEAD/DEAH box helicase domain-containing protein